MVEQSPDAAPPGPGAHAAHALVATLRRRYGLDPITVGRLGGEVDETWLITTSDQQRFVAKITPAGTDPAEPAWQARLLDDLARLPARPPSALEYPRPVVALDGAAVVASSPAGGPGLRVQTWLSGATLAELPFHPPELLRDWGRAAAHLVRALSSVRPHDTTHTHHWDVTRAPASIALGLPAVADPQHAQYVQVMLRRFADVVAPRLVRLPRQLVHQDLNDFNVLSRPDEDGQLRVTGVLDFGDALVAPRVCELAVAVAYAMLRKPDPLGAAAHVVAGFDEVVRLEDAELAVVYPLATARLCVNAVTWTARQSADNAYALARMEHTWPTLARLVDVPPAVAEHYLRMAAGRPGPPPAPAPAGLGWGPAIGRVQARHLGTEDVTPVRRTTSSAEPPVVRLGRLVVADAPHAVPVPHHGSVVESGPATVVLRHETPSGTVWARWDGLADGPPAGSELRRGQVLGRAPDATCEVALFTDLESARCAPRRVSRAMAASWAAVSPDPGTYLHDGPGAAADADIDVRALEARRTHHLASSQRHYYDRPMRLTSSTDVWLHDDAGRAYLDVINNVAHVGHANPAVLRAMASQAQRLNTNSRFLYDGMAQYADRLTSLLPDPLDVVFLVCTGSEANDLALRIARQVTGREHVLVVEGAYHGNTTAVTAVSPDRYGGPGGAGRPASTREVTQPNRYRGRWGYDDPDAGAHYAADVAATVCALVDDGTPPAAFLSGTPVGTAGTIVHPPGYLAAAFDAVRAAGGLCVSDEVQVGFGRLGSTFWGFETQQVVPDIVTMGKPIGNGHPMAAVVTTRAIADAFDTGMKYFNTFGGNPVSCAVGGAVLDEIAERDLQANARRVGADLLERLRALADRHAVIGDVRGEGLYLGVEFVRDRVSKAPSPTAARRIAERLKDEGVITYPTGALNNVLKIKPPMTFTAGHAALFADVLDEVLTAGW